MDKVWVGIDAGKEFHRAHVFDASGARILSRRIENDQADLSRLIEEALSYAEEVVWAIDQPGGDAALLSALLLERAQRVVCPPGLAVDRARDAYPGESETDARDARLIADQARMRPNLGELAPSEDDLTEPQRLLSRRRCLATDQTPRSISRLGNSLPSLFPALERALDLNNKGALALVTRYQIPAAVHRVGHERLAAVGDLAAFQSADNLAAYAGLVPDAHDFGNDRRMRDGNKVLKRVFYQSAFAGLRS